MKKFLATMSTIIMMFLLAFSFSGCNIINNNDGYLFSVKQLSADKFTSSNGRKVSRLFLEITVHDYVHLMKYGAYDFNLSSGDPPWFGYSFSIIGNKLGDYCDDNPGWILKDDAIYIVLSISCSPDVLSLHPERMFSYEFQAWYVSPLSKDKFKTLPDTFTDKFGLEIYTYISAPFTVKI